MARDLRLFYLFRLLATSYLWVPIFVPYMLSRGLSFRDVMILLVVLPFASNFLICVYAWMIILGPESAFSFAGRDRVMRPTAPPSSIETATPPPNAASTARSWRTSRRR